MGAEMKARARAINIVLVVVLAAVIFGIGMLAITVVNGWLVLVVVGTAGLAFERWLKRPDGVRDKLVDRMGTHDSEDDRNGSDSGEGAPV